MSRVKVFAADDHEALLADVGNLVTVVDSQRAIKSASSSKITRALLEKWAPDKDHFLMHVVAMGDDEHYGCNRNCFPAGTPVRTPSGFRAIETLNNGDLVLTAAKTYKPVTHLFRREFCGTQVSITAWNLAKPIVCTAEHPLQVLRKEHTVVGRLNPKVNGRRQGVERIAANFELATANAEFVEASNVCPGDWLRVPSEHGTGATLSWDPWMLGLYVADGCLAKEYKDITTKGDYKTLLFTLGSHDDAGVIPRLLSCLGDLGRKTSVQPSDTSEHGRRIAVGHKELAEFCLSTFGAQALTKTIGAAVFAQSVEWKLNFLAGLFDGDGCSGADDSISLSTASFDLASCVQRLLASCGIVSSVTCGFNDSDKGCFGRGRLPIYAVLVGAGRSNAIKSRSARFVPHVKDYVLCSKARIANGDLWVLVGSVLMEETTCPVFNIEVADEHTYVTTVAGHNCDAWSSDELDKTHGTFVTHAHFYREHENRRKNQRIGSVKDSVFNREMGRVELLVHGRLRPAPGEPLTAEPEYERARQGKNVDVSMSCSIHGDYCTACNHFAPTQDQYCGCFKKYRGRWSPEHQRKVYVLNKVKHFFDISSVKDRADHIARFLEYRFNDGSGFTRKAASLVLPTGYDVAEAYGMKDDHTYGLSTYTGLRRLSDMLTPAGVKAASIMFDDAQLTEAEADVFRAARKPALMLKMARAGVVLPFHSFVTVFSHLDHNIAAEDPVVKRAFALLPSVLRDFDGLEPLADMEPVFEAGSAAAENNGTDDVDGLMSAVAERLGMKPQPATTMNVTIIKLAALDLALPPEREQGAVKLAQAYTIYKAASLNNMERVLGRLSDYEVRVVASRF